MGHVKKHSYTILNKTTGEREKRKTKKWYCFYRKPDGTEARVPGYTDKKATEKLLARIEAEQDRIKRGLPPESHEDARLPLLELLGSFLEHLRAKDDTEEHVKLSEARIKRALEGCRIERFAQLDPDKVGAWLAAQRRKGMSSRTSNHYVSHLRTFTTWLSRKLKVMSPLDSLGKVNIDADRRHVRRALSDDELSHLVTTTEANSKVVLRLTGVERAMLYLVAAYTGLRASELAALTPELVEIAGDLPSLSVEAGDVKARRQAVVPIHPGLVARLKEWLDARPTGRPLWPGTWASHHQAARMLRIDLKAAGIPYRDQRGRVFDFHALRGQFITALARAGVSLVVAQKLARHSTPTLTSNYYTHLEQKDLAEGVAKLPDPPTRPRQA